MSLVSYSIVEPPEPIVTLVQAKSYLGIASTDDTQDVLVQSMIDAATAFLDGPNGWLGRFLGEQTVQATIAGTRLTRAAPIPLCGPVQLLTGATGPFILPTLFVEGDALTGFHRQWYFGTPVPAPLVITYTAGSAPPPPQAAAAILVAIQRMFTLTTHDPGLKSYQAADTKKEWNTDVVQAFDPSVLSLVAPLQVWR